MRLLDLYCGGGAAAEGYWRAGICDIVGVDIKPQPHYPYKFIQADALDFPLDGFDIIHASPPCQGFARTRHIVSRRGREYPSLIAPTRERLIASGLPWIMENVEGAPLMNPVTLCGTSFGLRVRRHRLFESSHLLFASGPCRHRDGDIGVYARKVTLLGSHATAYVASSGRTHYRPQTLSLRDGQIAMRVDWLPMAELCQAIPPAYTEWLGMQMLRQLVNVD